MGKDGRRDRIWIVIPAFNESAVLNRVLADVLKLNVEIVFVDDGSSDGTSDTASKFPAHLIRHDINLGQGAALQTGISYALEKGAEIIVTFDADGQMDPADIGSMVAALERSGRDVALGSRFLDKQPERIPAFRKSLLRAAALMTRLMAGLALTDAHNGFRAFKRSAAEKINITRNGMAHASEILQQIARHRMSFVEVPVKIRYTDYSLKKGQKTSNAFNILWELFFKC